MEDIFRISPRPEGLTHEELSQAVEASLSGRTLRRVLLIPPDFTRLHSNAGLLTNLYYHRALEQGAEVDILPALGSHVPMTDEELTAMFGDIPHDRFLIHNWRTDVQRIGEIPADYVHDITDGLWSEPVSVEINHRLLDPGYDLIVSIGQVVPHEVVGMSNHAKNLFVGVGGNDMINKSHMIGAVYGMERMMGRDNTPVRKLFDYGMTHFLADRPILFALTVTTAPGGHIQTHGLFIGHGRRCFSEAVKLSQQKNIDFVPHGLKKCVVYLDPHEFKSTWLGNKAIYRTRLAMADGGELVVLAPGVRGFGEDRQIDHLIRKYGYRGRNYILNALHAPESEELRENMSAAAHLIHGSSDGRFSITYAVKNLSQQAIASVGFQPADYDEMAKKYDPATLSYGFNTLDPHGEEIFFIPNPALGLWINRETFPTPEH